MKLKFLIVILLTLIIKPVSAQITLYDSLYTVMRVNYDSGNFEKAIELMNQLPESKSGDEEILLLKAECYYNTGQFAQAITVIEAAQKIKPESGLYLIAQSYAGLSDAKKSCEMLTLYLKKSGKQFESQIRTDTIFDNIENTTAWRQIWKQNYYSAYEKDLENANFEILRNNTQEAYNILDLLIKNNKSVHKALYMRGMLSVSEKNYKLAIQDFNKALELKNNENYLLARAECFSELKKFKNAKADLEELVSKDKYNLYYRFKLSLTQFELKEFDSGLENINYVLSFKEDENIHFLKGKILFAQNDFLAALKEFNTCVKMNKSKIEYFEALGDTYNETGSYEYALDAYSMILDLKPDSGIIYYKKGNTYFNSGDKVNACSCWEKAVSYKYYPASDKIEQNCKRVNYK